MSRVDWRNKIDLIARIYSLDGVHTAYSATDDVWQPAFMQSALGSTASLE